LARHRQHARLAGDNWGPQLRIRNAGAGLSGAVKAQERLVQIYEGRDDIDPYERVAALVDLGDCYLYTNDERALDTYRRAWQLKTKLSSPEEADEMFKGVGLVRLVLPENPADHPEWRVTVTYDVAQDGTVNVLDVSGDAPTPIITDMRSNYQHARFRPRIVGGEPVDTRGITYTHKYAGTSPKSNASERERRVRARLAHRMTRPLGILFVLALLALHPAGAQESGSPAPAPVATPPAAIPTAEIPARAEAAMTQLRTLQEQLKAETGVTEIKDALPERERLLDEAHTRDSARMSRFGLRQLEDVRQSWLRRKAELDAWTAAVQGRLDAVAQDQKMLDAMDAEWRATRKALHPGTQPPLLEQRTRSVAAELARTLTALNTHFDELLALQDRVLRLQLLVENTLNEIEDATAAARNALLHLDSPPLWEAFGGGEGGKVGLGAQFRESVAGVRQALAEWYEAYKPQLFAQVAIVLLLTLLTSCCTGARAPGRVTIRA
jgi:hypothetical protein